MMIGMKRYLPRNIATAIQHETKTRFTNIRSLNPFRLALSTPPWREIILTTPNSVRKGTGTYIPISRGIMSYPEYRTVDATMHRLTTR